MVRLVRHIPQISVRREGDDPDMGSDVKKAVDSIPAYVEAADMFVVLRPPFQHHNTTQDCHLNSWARRGWCLVELAAATFSRRTDRCMIVVKSSSNAAILFGPSFDPLPGLGDFTVEADRIAVFPVMEQIVDSSLEGLWRQPKQLLRARFMTSRRPKLLEGLGTPEQKEAVAKDSVRTATLEQFLLALRFASPMDRDKVGFGPIHAAAVAGNISVLKDLVSARIDVNERLNCDVPSLVMCKGDTPLHLAAHFGGDLPAVVNALIELRADPRMRNFQRINPIINALQMNNMDIAEVLHHHGAPLTEKDIMGGNPLVDVAGIAHPPSVQWLLRKRRT